MQGIVFNIQRFSVNDGPGIRTTVFLKGCPLSCWWCHNPEGISLGYENLNGREVGKAWEVADIFEEIIKDRIFYEESNGGVTFSGGEPTAQPDFLEAMLRQCYQADIHTAVDTSGLAETKIFQKIMPFTNLFLFDLKLFDPQEHFKYTGSMNALIMENLSFLLENEAKVNIRIPLIKGITATTNNLSEIIVFLNRFESKPPVSLLNYHKIAEGKYEKYGITSRMKGHEELSMTEMEEIRNLFVNSGFNVSIDN